VWVVSVNGGSNAVMAVRGWLIPTPTVARAEEVEAEEAG